MCFREITPIQFTELWAMKGKGTVVFAYLPSNNAECFLRHFTILLSTGNIVPCTLVNRCDAFNVSFTLGIT